MLVSFPKVSVDTPVNVFPDFGNSVASRYDAPAIGAIVTVPEVLKLLA